MKNTKEDVRTPAIGYLLAQVCRLVGSRRRAKLEGIGLRHAQGLILFRLWQEDGISQRVLARALHITPPTASNTLQRMERDGWIERCRDATDQRIVRVFLTVKSKKLREEAHASFKELDNEMTSMMTRQEQETLRQSLLKVRGYLIQAGDEDTGHACPGRFSLPDEAEKIR
ncbi:MarR family transcriptional regulator [uncultured Desulfosarcina sp.]|uniref:MarR family winged helix-turn-helix transcriptional regulator n=1 Tax=uncultured Desulfosarcina sp. TaxID=218289 RepID=UPI0029C67769|nr:MarR family transcriptional regulator [uncultured Desulfosarcina sp.]